MCWFCGFPSPLYKPLRCYYKRSAKAFGAKKDGAALTLLKAWNTGHPGGVTTIHSNTAMSALRRLEQLTAEVSQQPMQEVIGEAVDLIVSIERSGRGRRVRDVVHVERFEGGRYHTESYAQLDEDVHVA